MAGGLEKLADIIAPSTEQLPPRQAAFSSLQKGLKGVQAALESAQAGVFGEQVSTCLVLMNWFCCVYLYFAAILHICKLKSCLGLLAVSAPLCSTVVQRVVKNSLLNAIAVCH